MSSDALTKRPVSGKAILGIWLALMALALNFLYGGQTHTEGDIGRDALVGNSCLLFGCLSVALAGLAIKDIWKRRVAMHTFWPALAATGLAALAVVALLASARQASDPYRQESAWQIRRLGLALERYAVEHGCLPPAAVYDKTGRPLLSWRILVLPYLDAEDLPEPNLLKQFKLNEPWDGPHNRQLLEKMPDTYAPPKGLPDVPPYCTYYRVFHGKGAAFEGKESVRLADFPDGTGSTFLVVEAGEPVPWTKPDELEYNPQAPLPRLGGICKHGFNATFADGHTSFIPQNPLETHLRAAITRNGGEPSAWDW